ncbi:MAG: dihydroxyacetone kinase subunit DhaK [bacterium]|nr:dihydroxyacetone kinase subunit DhaK [bacterium]
MKKFLNDPEKFVDEMIQGIVAAHPGQLKYVADDFRCLVRADEKKAGKVGLATGGGSGHLPLFLGYVGQGMLDGCAVGGVFQSPSAQQMVEVTKAIDSGAGVLYIYGNYTGDIMNFEMASEMLEMDDIRTAHVLGAEDVASAPNNEKEKRRGVAGIFFVFKIAGAYAEEMASFDDVKRVADKVCANVRTMGVALSSCTIPEVGKPTFEIGEDEMEIGMGIHGEPGVRRGPLQTADEVVAEMLPTILKDLPYQRGDEVSVLMNGLGATPKEELYVMYRKVNEMLNAEGISVYHAYIGEFATSMEMAGASISLLKLDDELKRLLAKPANTPFFEQVQL